MGSKQHSIHCRGYRGTGREWNDNDCDCGATITNLQQRLAAAEAARDKYQQSYHLSLGQFAEVNAEAYIKLAEAREAARWCYRRIYTVQTAHEALQQWPWLKEVRE